MALASALDLRSDGDPRDGDSHDASPASLEAEQALLGAVLYEPEAQKLIGVELLAQHFYEPLHGRLWQAIVETLQEGLEPDPTFLATEFSRDPAFLEVGGVRYLGDLVDRAPPAMRAPQYASHILDLYHRRRLIVLSQEMAAAARDGRQTSLEIMASTETEVAKLRVAAAEPGAFMTARESAIRTLDEIEAEVKLGRPKGAQTGLDCFDARLGGLIPTWLITIGGRTSMGKTSLARAAMFGAAQAQPEDLFAFFSLEMPARAISERAIAASTRDDLDAVETQKLSRARVSATDVLQLRGRVERLPENLVLDDRPHLSIQDIRQAVWGLMRQGNLRAIAIDYLQLMRRPEGRGRTDASLIGDITQGLKTLAKEANICVLLLSQLNRAVEGRENKKPTLADLRESGSIEQDSDVVLFPFREAYYLERAEPTKDTSEHLAWADKLGLCERDLEVAVAKHRQGSIGSEKQFYDPAYDFIRNW